MPPTPKKAKGQSRSKAKSRPLKGKVVKSSKNQAPPAKSQALKSPSSPKPKPIPPGKPKRKSPRKSPGSAQRALVVGISAYPSPLSKLPAVAADVREMGKILRSKDGAFPSTGVVVLTERLATRKEILAALRATFGGATADQTVFVYLAGHGGIEDGQYYFIAHDTDCDRMAETGVPLTQIKSLFDGSRSHRVFLWLDFCHSGGILVRGRRTPMANDRFIIERTIGVVQGHGRLIVAACSPNQSAYEDPQIGHGLFTDALLRGLKGGAVASGEVTSNSLFDFIDREIGSARQRPMQFGHMTGRIVLMHYQDRSSGPAKPLAVSSKAKGKALKSPPKKKAPAKRKGTWVLLGRYYFLAQAVRTNKDGTFTLVISPSDGEEAANLANLRPGPYGGGSTLPFAWNNDAGSARVKEVESEVVGGTHAWTVTLTPQDVGSGGVFNEMSINTGGKNYSADDIARLRAGRILLNDPPPRSGSERSYDMMGTMLEGYIQGSGGRSQVHESPIRAVYAEHGRSPNWKHFARLQVVHTLKVSGTVDHILELTFGPVRAGRLPVRFRGRRDKRGTDKSTVIELSGSCPLG